jgi:hypothetical protein
VCVDPVSNPQLITLGSTAVLQLLGSMCCLWALFAAYGLHLQPLESISCLWHPFAAYVLHLLPLGSIWCFWAPFAALWARFDTFGSHSYLDVSRPGTNSTIDDTGIHSSAPASGSTVVFPPQDPLQCSLLRIHSSAPSSGSTSVLPPQDPL